MALLVAIVVFMASCSSSDNGEEKAYNDTTLQLIQLVENNPRVKDLLIKAIEKGKSINPDLSTNPVQSLEQYYDFVDRSQKAMPWDVIFCPGQPSVFGRMYQALCYCYFLNCMPLEELEGENFFTSSVQYVEPYL